MTAARSQGIRNARARFRHDRKSGVVSCQVGAVKTVGMWHGRIFVQTGECVGNPAGHGRAAGVRHPENNGRPGGAAITVIRGTAAPDGISV